MYFKLGIHTFKRGRNAFRREYCQTCDGPVISLRTRCWSFLTLFFIPILPVGVRWRWICANCGERPEAHPGLTRLNKVILLLFLGLLILGAFAVDDEDPRIMLVIRIVLILLALWALVSIARHRDPDPAVRLESNAHLATLAPETVCPICREGLHLVDGGRQCRSCRLFSEETPPA